MKCLAKNSVHSKSTIQKNILGRFFGSSKNRVFKIVLLVFGLLSMLGSTHALFNGTVGLDLGFNILSPVEFNAEVRAVVVQSDGKMVVGGGFTIYSGETANRIVRLNSDGSRDVSFLGAGTNNPVYVVAIQSDGKILIGGSFVRYDGTTSNRIARLNSNGTIDTGFIIGGGFNDAVYDVKVQADGKILVGGNFTTYSGASAPYFVRLNSDGTRDTSFTNFAFNGYIYTIAIQDDDKILVGGAFTLYSGATANRIIRLNSDGTRDTSFLGAGAGNGIVYAIGRQSDGKIIIGGSFTSYNGGGIARILRLNTDGTKDTSFLGAGAGGAVWSLAIQSGDKIVVGGAFTTYNGVATNRIVGLNADGTTDVNFVVGNGADGIVYALTLQSDEKIIAGGAFTQYNGQGANYFVRLNTDGTKDTNPAGYGFNSYILTLTIQSDQKILVGGGFTTYSGTIANKIVRLNSDGTRDSTFSVGDGCVGNVYVFAVQGDGKILVGGDCTSYDGVTANRIFRLNSDGTRDTSFLGAGANGTVYDIKIQSDGKILVAGNFTTYSGASSPYLVRLNSDGTKDTSFVPGTFNAYVYSVDIQSDGKIVAGGNFTTHNTITTNRLIRLTSTGARDTSFSIGAGLSAYPQKIIVQEDQKILIGGTFGTYSGATVNRIVRLNSDGTRDTSFVGGTAFNGSTRGIIIQSDGKMIVGGAYTSYNGVLRNRIVRINTDGSPDASFSIGGGFNEQIYALAAQANGRILVGGNFTQYDGALAGFISSLYVLQPPTLLSPLSGDVDQSTSKDFLRSPSVDSGVVGYIYQVSTDSGFSTFTTSGTTTQTGISLTGFTEGMYYRRVAVYDAAGNIGGRSTTENFIVTPTDWDNSQFITGAFRASNPSDTKIIYALFGDGNGGTGRSAYTKNRDTINCSLGSMVVTGISPGTNTLPVNLSANTIYVLESGEYIVSATRTLQNCTAIIGKGDVVLKANYTTNTRLLSSDSKSNRILDNLKLDRNRGVATSTSMDVIYTLSSPNNSINAVEAYSGYSGIYVYLGSNYLSITNSKAYDNLSIGMYIRKSTYGVISSADIYNNTSYGVYFNGSDTGNLINSQIHDNSTHGVYYNLSNNGKIENSQVYNNGSYGIYFNTSHNGIIKNSQIFNSTNRGVSYIVSNSGQILDSQIYNNGDYGITIYNDSQYTTINNTQLYNNANYGIHLLNGANYTTINNTQVYNNGSVGILIESGSYYSVLNNVQIYNNASYGIQYKNNSASGTITTTNVFNNTREGILIDAGSINTKYYGINKIFANDAMNLSGTLANLTPGTDNMLGRSNGVIDESPTMSRDYLTNPVNNLGEYLFSRTGTITSLRGRNTSFVATSGMQYSYGSGTRLQTAPVVYDGDTLVASGEYGVNKYIGSNTSQSTGVLLGSWLTYIGNTMNVIGSTTSALTKYSIYGDIVSTIYGVDINTSTGIVFVSGGVYKKLITQMYTPIPYASIHFETLSPSINQLRVDYIFPSQSTIIAQLTGYAGLGITILNNGGSDTYMRTDSQITGFVFTIQDSYGNTGEVWAHFWDNNNYIDQSFWELNPDDQNIISALYGSNDSWLDTTVYTQSRSGRDTTQCSGDAIQVVRTDTLDITSLGENTIYVVANPLSIMASTTVLANCSAVISKNATGTLFTSTIQLGGGMFSATSKQYIIVDNLSIDGDGGDSVASHAINNYGIYLYSASKNNTIYHTKTFGNVNGVVISTNSENNVIYDSQMYENSYGIFLSVNSTKNTIQNSQSYKNNNVGIYLSAAPENKILDTQVYNNIGDGVYIYNGSHKTFINNMQSYNNALGIECNASTESVINNTQIYNNDTQGLRMTNTCGGTMFNDIQSYNNGTYGLYTYNSNPVYLNDARMYNNGTCGIAAYASIIYYGVLNAFANSESSCVVNGQSNSLAAGTVVNRPYAGWTAGVLVTGTTLSRDYLTNPQNTSGEYMLSWTGNLGSVAGKNNTYSASTTQKYSYGSGTYLQSQPITYNGSVYIAEGDYQANEYVGSHIAKGTGELVGIDMIMSNEYATVMGSGATPLTRYTIYGDVVTPILGAVINTFTGIQFVTGRLSNTLITQMYNPIDYFAMHFQNTLIVDTTEHEFIRTGNTPSNNAWISSNSFDAQLDITEFFLTQFSRSRSGIQYPIYDSGLILMYNFDNVAQLGESNGIVKDLSQYSNNGVGYGGVTWTGAGKRNGGYTFDGVNDYIQGTNLYSIGGITTISARVRFNNFNSPSQNPRIIEIKDDLYSLQIIRDDSTNKRATKNSKRQTNNIGTVRSVASTGIRYNVIAIFDGNNSTTRFYINGVEQSGSIYSNIGIGSQTNTFNIGRRSDGVLSSYLNGQIDEVRIYNRALSADEISLLYNSNLNKYDTDKWNFTVFQTGMLPGIMYGYTGTMYDLANTTATGRSVGYDAIGPIFTFADDTGPECISGTLSITNASDAGIGLDSTPYSFDGTSRNTLVDLLVSAQQPGVQIRTGRVRDQFQNSTFHTATYTFTDVGPTANDFTGHTNVANTSPTVNRKTLSSASEGSCGTSDIVYDSIFSQGTKGTCSVVGNTITYTPNTGQEGDDACTITIKDNENTSTNIIIYRQNIDTNGPSSPILLSPTHGSSSTTGTIDLLRSGSVDAGVGLSGYIWQLSTGSNFATLMSGGSTTTTGVSLSGLAMTTYYRRVYAVDNLGNTGSRSTGRSFTIAPAITFAIESPASLDLGSLATPEETQIVEKTFTGSENYFVLSDYVGDDAGYYTTLSMTNMTNGNGALLSNQNIAIKTATNIVTIAGSSNPNVVSAITGSYRTFGNDVLTFIKRDPGPNAGMIGTYGVSPALKVTIPQLQNSGNYSGTLIYTIYPN